MSKKDNKPNYFDELSQEDQENYLKLQQALASPACKNRRNKSNETFEEVLETIRRFIYQDDENDLKRSLVCGICWLESTIAINTHQLRILTSKCKSSINGSFQNLGYGTIPTGADSAGELIRKFPHLKNNFSQLRQWTVRQKLSDVQTPAKLCELFKNRMPKTEKDTEKLEETPILIESNFETPPPNFLSDQNSFSLDVCLPYSNLPKSIVDDDLKISSPKAPESDPFALEFILPTFIPSDF